MNVYIGTGIVVLVQLLTAAFIYGRFTQKVADHDKRFEEVGARFRQDEQTLEKHHSEIGVVYGRMGLRRQ